MVRGNVVDQCEQLEVDVAPFVGLLPRCFGMHPKVVEHLRNKSDSALLEELDVGHPVPIEAPIGVGSAHGAKRFEANERPRGIGNHVMQQHKMPNLMKAVVSVALNPALGLGSVDVAVVHVKTVHRLALGIDQHGLAVRDYEVGIGLHHTNQPLEQVRVGKIVALGNPEVASACQRGGLVPLGKGASGIFCIGVNRPSRPSCCKFLKQCQGPVGRGVVEQEYLHVLKGLVRNARQALP